MLAGGGCGAGAWHGILEDAAAERERNSLKYFKYLCLINGSSQGQKLALTALVVPNGLTFDVGRFWRQALIRGK